MSKINREKEASLSLARLKEFMEYNSETGEFIRLLSKGGTRIGEIVGCRKPDGYLVSSIDGQNYYLQRLAWFYYYGKFPEYVIDHINGVPSDNRIVNLRDVPQRTNCQNKMKQKRINPSIPQGVEELFRKDGSLYAYRAHWQDSAQLTKHSPVFNITRYGGRCIALQLAAEYRNTKITEVASEGAEYTQRHGK